MRRLIFVLNFISSVVAISSYGQGKEDFTKRLYEIKQKYTEINNYRGYKTKTIADAEVILGQPVDEGASLTGYYKGDTLVKIVEWAGLSNRTVQNEYFYDKGKLFFVYAKEVPYTNKANTRTIDHSRLADFFTGRYYFENQHLFDVILSDKKRLSSKEQDGARFIAAGKRYVRLLANH